MRNDEIYGIAVSHQPRSRVDVLLTWLSAQPLVPAAVGLVVGILLDRVCPLPCVAAVLLFLSAGGVIAWARDREGIRHVAIALAALAIGAMLHDLSFRQWPTDHVVRYCGRGESTLIRLTGTVISSPRVCPQQSGRIAWFRQSPRSRFLVSAEKIEGVDGDMPVSGIVSVLVRQPALEVAAGDRVELFGWMSCPKGPANPGSVDYALIARRKGILVEMTCKYAANVTVLSHDNNRYRWFAWLRRRARSALLDQTFPGDMPGSQLLSAMVLGQRSAVKADLNDAFIRTGTVHYLSVSGAHVGMLVSVVWLAGFVLGSSRRTCAAWALVLATTYALVAEPRPPILRATVMADFFCLAVLLRRPVRTGNWLALSMLILLSLDPMQLFSAGFQMSYATVLAIIYISPQVHALGSKAVHRVLRQDDPLLMADVQMRLNPSWRRRLGYLVARVTGTWLAISVSAWMMGALWTAYHFGQFTLWGWLNSTLILPFVWLTLVLGLAKTIVSTLMPVAAPLVAWPLTKITEALIGLVHGLSALPGSCVVTAEFGNGLLLAGLVVACLWMARSWLRISGHSVTMAGLTFLVLVAWRLAPGGSSETLRMYVLSVGSGATSVIRLPNGKTLIYDIGSYPPFDIERSILRPLLARERVYGIDAVVLSHPNLDHFCGLPDLIERRSVGPVFASDHFAHLASSRSAAGRLMSDLQQKGVSWQTIHRGDRLTGAGDVVMEVLWPPTRQEYPIFEANDSSVVLRITHAGYRLLLTGDIEEQAQQHLLATCDLKADVLILPHHGGVGAATNDFIQAVDPTYCVRSSSQRNQFTTNGLLQFVGNRQYLNTADDGAVQIELAPGELRVCSWLRGSH